MADKLVRPLNAPPAGAAAYGVQPGSTSGVVRANLLIIFGSAGEPTGVFVYQAGTTPGPGNPPIVSIGNNTKDPFGNAVFPGVSTYGPAGQIASLSQAQLLFFNSAAAASIGMSSAGGLVISANAFPVEPVFIESPLNAVFGTAANPTVITTDAPHDLGGVTGSNCSILFDRYWLTPEQETLIDISLEALAGGSTAGTYTFANTLPTEYVPRGVLRVYPMAFNAPITTATQDCVLVVDGASGPVPGRVRITIPSVAANVFYGVSQRIPLI